MKFEIFFEFVFFGRHAWPPKLDQWRDVFFYFFSQHSRIVEFCLFLSFLSWEIYKSWNELESSLLHSNSFEETGDRCNNELLVVARKHGPGLIFLGEKRGLHYYYSNEHPPTYLPFQLLLGASFFSFFLYFVNDSLRPLREETRLLGFFLLYSFLLLVLSLCIFLYFGHEPLIWSLINLFFYTENKIKEFYRQPSIYYYIVRANKPVAMETVI